MIRVCLAVYTAALAVFTAVLGVTRTKVLVGGVRNTRDTSIKVITQQHRELKCLKLVQYLVSKQSLVFCIYCRLYLKTY